MDDRHRVGMDTRTPMGKAMAPMAVVFAELERDFIRAHKEWGAQVVRTSIANLEGSAIWDSSAIWDRLVGNEWAHLWTTVPVPRIS